MNEMNHNNLEIQNQEIARQSEAQAEQNAKQHEEFGRKLESNNLSMGDNYGELKQIEGQDKASKDISEVDRGDKDLAENRKLDIHGEQDIENTGEDEEHSQLVSLSTIGGETFAETSDFDAEELSAEEYDLLKRAELDYPVDETSDFDAEELSAEEYDLLKRAELDYPIDETSDFDAEELSAEEYDLLKRAELDHPIDDTLLEEENDDFDDLSQLSKLDTSMPDTLDDGADVAEYDSELANNSMISAEWMPAVLDEEITVDSADTVLAKTDEGMLEQGVSVEVTVEGKNNTVCEKTTEDTPLTDIDKKETQKNYETNVITENVSSTLSEYETEGDAPENVMYSAQNTEKNYSADNTSAREGNVNAELVKEEIEGVEEISEGNSETGNYFDGMEGKTETSVDSEVGESRAESIRTESSDEQLGESERTDNKKLVAIEEDSPAALNAESGAEGADREDVESFVNTKKRLEDYTDGVTTPEEALRDNAQSEYSSENNVDNSAHKNETDEKTETSRPECGDGSRTAATELEADPAGGSDDHPIQYNSERRRETEEHTEQSVLPLENHQDQLNVAPWEENQQNAEWVDKGEIKDTLEVNDIDTERFEEIVDKVKNGDKLSVSDETFLYEAEKTLRSDAAVDGEAVTDKEAGNALSHLTKTYYGMNKENHTSDPAVRDKADVVHYSSDNEVAPWTPQAKREVFESTGKPENSDAATDAGEKLEKRTLDDITVTEAFEMMKKPEGRTQLESMIAEQREAIEADWYGMSVEEYREHKALLADNHETQDAEINNQPDEENDKQEISEETSSNEINSGFKDFLKNADEFFGKVENFLWIVLQKDFELIGKTAGTAIGGDVGGLAGKVAFEEAAKSLTEKLRFKPAEEKNDQAETITEQNCDADEKSGVLLNKGESFAWTLLQKTHELIGETFGTAIGGDVGGLIGKVSFEEASKWLAEKLRFKPAEEKNDQAEIITESNDTSNEKPGNILDKGESFAWTLLQKTYELIGEMFGDTIGGDIGGLIGKVSYEELVKWAAEDLRFKPAEEGKSASAKCEVTNSQEEAVTDKMIAVLPTADEIVTHYANEAENTEISEQLHSSNLDSEYQPMGKRLAAIKQMDGHNLKETDTQNEEAEEEKSDGKHQIDNVMIAPGQKVYALQVTDEMGEQTDYFFDQATYDFFVQEDGGFDAKALSEALQVPAFIGKNPSQAFIKAQEYIRANPDMCKHPSDLAKIYDEFLGKSEYRISIAAFDVKEPINATIGICQANASFGGGGAHQAYISPSEFHKLKYNENASLCNRGKYIPSFYDWEMQQSSLTNSQHEAFKNDHSAIEKSDQKNVFSLNNPIPGSLFGTVYSVSKDGVLVIPADTWPKEFPKQQLGPEGEKVTEKNWDVNPYAGKDVGYDALIPHETTQTDDTLTVSDCSAVESNSSETMLPSFTESHKMAVLRYTDCKFSQIHMDKDADDEDTQTILNAFDEGIFKPYEGAIFRGLSFNSKREAKKALGYSLLPRGEGEWHEPSITSFSSSKSVAEGFARKEGEWGLVLICENNKTAIDISPMMLDGKEDSEHEILSPGDHRTSWTVDFSTMYEDKNKRITYVHIRERE